MRDFEKNSQEMPKKLSRRNLLRNTLITVTSSFVMLLFLSGCTKEQLDIVKGQLPGGGVGSAPDTWYQLRIVYKDEDGTSRNGYLARISTDPIVPQRNYMQVSPAGGTKFKLHQEADGWAQWESEDGKFLSLTNGWAWLSSDRGDEVRWKIVGGKLYNNYWSKDHWQDYPAGAEYYKYFVVNAYYVGVALSNGNVFTCELVPVP